MGFNVITYQAGFVGRTPSPPFWVWSPCPPHAVSVAEKLCMKSSRREGGAPNHSPPSSMGLKRGSVTPFPSSPPPHLCSRPSLVSVVRGPAGKFAWLRPAGPPHLLFLIPQHLGRRGPRRPSPPLSHIPRRRQYGTPFRGRASLVCVCCSVVCFFPSPDPPPGGVRPAATWRPASCCLPRDPPPLISKLHRGS